MTPGQGIDMGKGKNRAKTRGWAADQRLPVLAFIVATLFVLYWYLPVLTPVLDNRLQFCYGDFTSIFGDNSAAARAEFTFNTYVRGVAELDWNRAFLLEWLSVPVAYLGGSDAQVQSILILASLLIGAFGLDALIRFFGEGNNPWTGVALRLIIIPFYFLNLWSVDRIIHLLIWVTYAVLPAMLYLGLSFTRSKRMGTLVAYSLVFSVFGMVPHSAIYAGIIHGVLSLYMLVSGAKGKEKLAFIMLPIAIYALANLPILIMPLLTKVAYPYSVDTDMSWVLSNNGQMIRALSIANNWWPQVPASELGDNLPYRESSICTISAIVLMAVVSYGRLSIDRRWLVVLSILAILSVLFIAQGMNNPVFGAILDAMNSHGLLQLMAPFREWARLSIMIPVFLCVLALVALESLPLDWRGPAIAALLMLVAINISTSPSWDYLHKVESAIPVPKEYNALGEEVSQLDKNVVIEPMSYAEAFGNPVYAWNGSKAKGPTRLSAISNGYSSNAFGEIAASGEMPQSMLDALDISQVILVADFMNSSGYPSRYSWLDYRNLTYFIVCQNDHNVSKFNVYGSDMLVDAHDEYLPYFMNRTVASATSFGGRQADYVLLNDPLAYTVQDARDESKALVVAASAGTDIGNGGWVEGSDIQKVSADSDIENDAMYSWTAGSSLSIPLDIDEAGEYTVFVQASVNDNNGTLGLMMGNDTVRLDTGGYGDRFHWLEAGSFPLVKGLQNLTIINMGGNDSVEGVALIKDDQLESIRNDTETVGPRPIYFLEVRKDFSVKDPSRVRTISIGRFAIDGSLLEIDNDTALQRRISVLEDGDYLIAFKGQGNYSFTIAGQSENLSSPSLGFNYLGPFHLSKGDQELTIMAKAGSYADTAMLYGIPERTSHWTGCSTVPKGPQPMCSATSGSARRCGKRISMPAGLSCSLSPNPTSPSGKRGSIKTAS